MNDEPVEIPLDPVKAHSVCSMCGGRSGPGKIYCDHCLADLRARAADFKPYMEIVKRNKAPAKGVVPDKLRKKRRPR